MSFTRTVTNTPLQKTAAVKTDLPKPSMRSHPLDNLPVAARRGLVDVTL